jgi:hypothetical protein
MSAGLAALLLLSLPVAAFADPSEEPQPPRQPVRHRAAEILLDMDDARDREAPGSFRIRKRYGFEYARRFESAGGAPWILSIQGPAMPRKRLGLTFEVRF